MKIAIPTDDRINIANRTGRAIEFAIYTLENGIVQNVEYKKNTHHHEEGEHHHHGEGQGHHGHSHADMVEQLKGIDVFLVSHLGSHFKDEVESANIPYKIIKGKIILEILDEYIQK